MEFRNLTLIGLAFVAGILARCTKDIIVKDISLSAVSVNAPADSVVTSANVVTFWWEPVDGATGYNLQIVEPDFSKIRTLVLDTLTAATKFKYSLLPGTYQWRIKAANSVYSSDFRTFSLIVDTTNNLSVQEVLVLNPVNGYLTRDSVIEFSWFPVSGAIEYHVEIAEGISQTTDKTTLSVSVPAPNNQHSMFSWKLRASNEVGATPFTTVRTFTVDRKPPIVSSQLKPTSSAVFAPNLSSADSLSWLRSSSLSILEAKYDTIYVATDSLFSTASVVARNRVNAQLIKVSDIKPNLPLSSVPLPYYYWCLATVDSAGNRSTQFSQVQKFRLLQQ